ncbi:MAG: fold metallo-hydrolase [Rhodospirillales bacterium]|nr:fold metallo-hydrolase [Rhodospirillales bacterium]
MRVRVLGCGASGGVPRIGGDWGACDPSEPKNRRRRVSILVETGDTTILVDTSPDLREQLLDAGTRQVDAVIITHSHADHLHGLDDLRALNRLMRRTIPLYAEPATMREIATRFDYVLQPAPPDAFYKPLVIPHEIDGPFEIAGIPIIPFHQDHGFGNTTGLRIGDIGYSTDVVEMDEAGFRALAGIDIWIVDCLRYEPHPTHSHLAKTLGWIDRIRPRRAVLTHMDVQLDYATLRRELPAGVEPGYDSLTIETAKI